MFLLQILVGLNTQWRHGWVILSLFVVVVVVSVKGVVHCSGSCDSSCSIRSNNTSSSGD